MVDLPVSKREVASDLALWIAAGLIVLAVHVGGAIWLLHEDPMASSDDLPPAAIMIDLAETPEATMTEENEISPDQMDAEASTQAQQVDASEDTPDVEMPEPVEETSEAEPQEEYVAQMPVLDDVEVPLPVARPTPPEKKEVVDRKKPEPQKRQQAQAASRQAVQAQAQVSQSNRNAARQVASGSLSSMTPATWKSRLMAHLERRKKYPPGAKARGERGIVYVRFVLDNSGNVLATSLARSSGFPDLDQEVLSLVRRASPVPPPPPGVSRTVTAPVRFSTR